VGKNSELLGAKLKMGENEDFYYWMQRGDHYGGVKQKQQSKGVTIPQIQKGGLKKKNARDNNSLINSRGKNSWFISLQEGHCGLFRQKKELLQKAIGKYLGQRSKVSKGGGVG